MPDLAAIVLPDWLVVALQILLIVVGGIAAFLFGRGFLHRIFQTLMDREAREGTARDLSGMELQRRIATLDSLAGNMLRFFVVVIAGLMILGRLGVDIGPAIAGLGIVGIAVGFGAQSLVKDYFNGILILIENQYGKDDVVRIAGVEGTVEDLTLRRTTLRDASGNLHTIPNSAVVVASNLTRGYAVINEELQVPAMDLVDPATAAVNGVGQEMADDPEWKPLILEPAHVDRIGSLTPSGITLLIDARVVAGARAAFTAELRRRMLERFRERELPLVPGSAAVTAPLGSVEPPTALPILAVPTADAPSSPSGAGQAADGHPDAPAG